MLVEELSYAVLMTRCLYETLLLSAQESDSNEMRVSMKCNLLV